MTEKLSPERSAAIAENWKIICESVAEASERARTRGFVNLGSGIEDVRIVAATKTVPVDEIAYAASLGLREMGENRVQELTAKLTMLPDGLQRHFIGSLQTNKVRMVVGNVSLIHSLDSLRLAAEIDKRASAMGIVQDVLVELNIGREGAKGGVEPEQIRDFLDELDEFSSLSLRGMMVIGPICAEKAEYQKIFEESYQIFIDNFSNRGHNNKCSILSMGMSGSYVTAIECGANMIRPGSALFGVRR